MNKILAQNRYFFGLFGSKIQKEIICAPIHTALNTEAKVYTPQTSQYQITKLASGIQVLTQSVSVPSTVHFGIFIDYGTRDQTQQTSGAMLSLKNTFLKTAINTSETVNYGIRQMSGGQFEMDYNRQNAYYQGSCLSHDVVDVFSMATDCAFEPKNYVSTAVGMYKNKQSHKLESQLGGNQIFVDNIFQAAYGSKNLGMPFQGYRNNVGYLGPHVIQKFQAENIYPQRIVISAAGIECHEQFVDLVTEKLASNLLSEKKRDRENAAYIGGEVRNLTEANYIHLVLAFEGANHKNSLPLLLAEQILGVHPRGGRITKNVLNKHVFIDNAQTLNCNYADTGLFGLKLAGSASHAKQILNIGTQVLNSLRNISQSQFELAKQSLKGKLNRSNISTCKRLEQRTKSLYYLGKTNEHLTNQIDAVTLKQVEEAISKTLKSPLTFVCRGGEVNVLPSYDNISKRFV